MTSQQLFNTSSTALVTGASSGIGAEIARQLAKLGANLILVARSEDKLEALASELRPLGIQIYVIPLDLAEIDAGQQLENEINTRSLAIDLLINNAGFGDFGDFWERPHQEISEMIQVNITVLTELMRRFLPEMVKRGRGRVLNVGSVASFMPGPRMAEYFASKAYVLHLSEAVNEELRSGGHTGVSVTSLCPGPTSTNFDAVAGMKNSTLNSDTRAELSRLPVEYVARQGIEGMIRGQSVVIPGRINQIQAFLPRITPRGLAIRLLSRLSKAKKN